MGKGRCGVDQKMVWHVSEQRDQENKKRKPNVEYSEHLLLSPALFTRDICKRHIEIKQLVFSKSDDKAQCKKKVSLSK